MHVLFLLCFLSSSFSLFLSFFLSIPFTLCFLLFFYVFSSSFISMATSSFYSALIQWDFSPFFSLRPHQPFVAFYGHPSRIATNLLVAQPLGVCVGWIWQVKVNISIQSTTNGLGKFQSITNPPKFKFDGLVTNLAISSQQVRQVGINNVFFFFF